MSAETEAFLLRLAELCDTYERALRHGKLGKQSMARLKAAARGRKPS